MVFGIAVRTNGIIAVACSTVMTLVCIRCAAAAPRDNNADFYVSPHGRDSNNGSRSKPWATIQHAATKVHAGATIHVAPGTYASAVVTKASGTMASRIRFLSEERWGAKLRSSGANATWLNYGDYVDIIGFDVTGDGHVGIDNKGSFVRVIANHIHDVPVRGCPEDGGAGIDNSNYQASDDEVIANLVHDIGEFGTVCQRVHGIYHANLRGRILNNIVFRAQSWGIHLYHYAANVQVVNNTVFNNGGLFNGNAYGGGIVVSNPSDGPLEDDYTVVLNNLVFKNPGWGIDEAHKTGPHNEYRENLIYGNGNDLHLQHGVAASGTVAADPQFINYTGDLTGDYRLKSTSPAIHRGDTSHAPPRDFNGAVRPTGATPDIGAYQFGSEPAPWPWM